jgi:hypothetical protein
VNKCQLSMIENAVKSGYHRKSESVKSDLRDGVRTVPVLLKLADRGEVTPALRMRFKEGGGSANGGRICSYRSRAAQIVG